VNGQGVKPPKYTFDLARLTALDSLDILDTPSEPGFDDIVSLAAHVCETPVALVSFVAGDRQWFKARVGFEACETDLSRSVCAHALIEPELLVIPDLSQDHRTRDNPLVIGAPQIRFYAGAPLRTAEGHVLGSLCVIDGTARPAGLRDTQREMLKALARQVMTQLELHQAVAERDAALLAQRRSVDAIRAGQEQFHKLFALIDDGFCIVEMKFDGEHPIDYRFVEVNSAFVDQTGIVNAQGAWMRDVAPDHEQHWFDIYGRVALTGEPVRFESPAKELGDRWYEVHAFRVGEPGQRRVAILFNDITARKADELQRLQSEADQKTLNIELSHRIKNSFAMVQAIASQTLRTLDDQAPVEAFSQRLHAMSSAHDLLLQQNWTSAEIEGVVRAVMPPIAPLDRFDISGPKVTLGPRATMSFSLLLHELTTNAAKYGALSNERGRVSVEWRVQDKNGQSELVLNWVESGGPQVRQPTRNGFGSRLLKLGLIGAGGVDLSFPLQGFRAEFTAPLELVQQS